MNLADILLDEENREDIEFEDEDGNTHVFKQLAVIPHEGKLYCVLTPVLDDDSDDTKCVIFRFIAETDQLIGVDEEMQQIIFERMLELVEEQQKRK